MSDTLHAKALIRISYDHAGVSPEEAAKYIKEQLSLALDHLASTGQLSGDHMNIIVDDYHCDVEVLQ